MSTKKTTKGSPTPRKVPDEQWSLPVSIAPDGRFVTLQEFAEGAAAALSFGQLSPPQQSELVAARIERQPMFELAMVGAGIVDKERAVQEVRARTPVGKTLIEIEQRMIARMVKRANQEA
jgi:hypothetical protein